MIQRLLFFIYGVACHVLFFGVYAAMAGFVGNFGFGVTSTIDAPRTGSLVSALVVDTLLIVGFGVQHTVMARPGFKKWWTRFVPAPIERSTYVLISCILTVLLLWQWRPLGGEVWNVTHPVGTAILHGLFAVGWLAVPAASLMIDHFDLFGTRQVWLHLMGREYTVRPFRTPAAYAHVRHPLYVGWLTAFWATPTMTVSHLLFAGLFTAYIFIAIPFEERDLVGVFGDAYTRYRERVGALIPRLGRGPRLDLSALRDVSWWSWSVMAVLLSFSFAVEPWPIVAAIGWCAALVAYDCWAAEGDLGAMSVQVRVGYLTMLLAGVLPGMRWLHVLQLVGAILRNLTGYCLLSRLLALLPWNHVEPLTLARTGRILVAVPGGGGLLRFDGGAGASTPCENAANMSSCAP